MAAVGILAAFGYKWAQDGTIEAIDDAQYKAGWAFVGATPPSVEQFNKVHQVADEKANYLYAQMDAVFAAAGEVPSPGDLNSLRDSIAATTRGRLLQILYFGANGSYVPSTGTRYIRVTAVGGGGAGGGTVATGAAQVAAGSGGGSGSYAQAGYLTAALAASIAVSVGANGLGIPGSGGGNGGTTSFGPYLTAPGGNGGAPMLTPVSNTSSGQSGHGAGGVAPTGSGIIVSGRGNVGTQGIALLGAPLSGIGAASVFGGAAPGVVSGVAWAGSAPGAGGGGAAIGFSTAASTGGNGAGGLVVIEEFA